MSVGYTARMPAIPDALDAYLPLPLRAEIENRYYARVTAQARLERVLTDPLLFDGDETHLALFTDHGVVHVRDVAQQVIRVLDTVAGVLIPSRPAARFDPFMKGLGVCLAYLHDIGMANPATFGRRVHAAYAVQAPFMTELDSFVDQVWHANCGGLAERLESLAAAGDLACDPRVVLRELLALAGCHSKSMVGVELLNQPARLRRRLQATLAVELEALLVTPAPPEPGPRSPDRLLALSEHYADFDRQSFAWLDGGSQRLCALIDDAVDTVRALRCADALRQRGTVLKTSAGYEILLDRTTGQATYALRAGDEKLFLLSFPQPLVAGEANLASAELTPEGDLRFAFHRGAFADDTVTAYVTHCAALVVNDIHGDAVLSFERAASAAHTGGCKPVEAVALLLESPNENPGFADGVAAEFRRLNPHIANPVRSVPSLQDTHAAERDRYLAAGLLNWSEAQRQEVADKLGSTGQRAGQLNLDAAFEHVRLVRLQAGDCLVEAGAGADFVYLPMGAGLRVEPLGGYPAFLVQPWMLLGISGVIRGRARNATIVATQPLDLLMIPREVYLQHWHHPFTPAELKTYLQAR